MKPVQYFTDDYLQQCQNMTPRQILEYLESFRVLNTPDDRSKLISMKVPALMLGAFRKKCELHGVRYQTQIKNLMKDWLGTP